MSLATLEPNHTQLQEAEREVKTDPMSYGANLTDVV